MFWCPSAELTSAALGPSDGEQHQEAVQKHEVEVAHACAMAITNIQQKLVGLAQHYPALSAIGDASIEAPESPHSCNYHLHYAKDNRFVLNHNEEGMPAAQMPQRAGSDVIERDGAQLDVLIQDMYHPSGMRKFSGDAYPILFEGRIAKLYLVYSFQLGSSDSNLEATAKQIVENQVSELCNSLRVIIGSDPCQERVLACGSVMTNILSQLKLLAPKFPALAGVGSASIENKGPLYVFSHMRFWTNAHAEVTTNARANQEQPFNDRPVLGNGGVALDVFMLNEDEPFGFFQNNASFVYSPLDGKHKIELFYRFNSKEVNGLNDAEGGAKDAAGAVKSVIESQAETLRTAMDNIIDFGALK
jgi:hypothetical protein